MRAKSVYANGLYVRDTGWLVSSRATMRMIVTRPCSPAERGLSISCCMERIMRTCDAAIVKSHAISPAEH